MGIAQVNTFYTGEAKRHTPTPSLARCMKGAEYLYYFLSL